MEKGVDCDYFRTKHDSSESFKTGASWNNLEVSKKKKFMGKQPKRRKKIAADNRSDDWQEGRKKIVGKKSKKVLNDESSTSTRQSISRYDTKIVNRQVPDRLGKFVVTSECVGLDEKPISPERADMDFLLKDYSETKLYMIGNECLSNKEAVSFSNSFESDSEAKNIFENFFDDCLGSTSVLPKNASSQDGISNVEIDKNNEDLSELKSSDPKTKKTSPPRFPKTLRKRRDQDRGKKVRHVCTYCQKIFKSSGKLNSHVYSHTGERPFDCNNCGKAFSSKFKLVRHLLIHSEVRKFVCQICDRTFLRNDHLKNHYKVHDPQKKMYKCQKKECSKEYSSLMSHKKHMAYHSVEDGDLKCSICGVKYESKEEILFHLKSHSGSRLFKSQSDKKFKCQFCDRLFLTRKDVTRHLVVHTGERDFLCQFCPQRFGRKDHLVRHIKKSHGEVDVSVKNETEDGSESSDFKISKKPPKRKATADSASANNFKSKEPEVTESRKILESRPPISESSTSSPPEDATRIVITVAGETERQKQFGKRVSSADKVRNSTTTQILLRNVPNILIIPNNSIILVGGPAAASPSKTVGKGSKMSSEAENVSENIHKETGSSEEMQSDCCYAYEDSNPNVFRSSEFSSGFSETEAFSNFNSADLTDFNPAQFEETEPSLGFDLLKKPTESLLNLIQPEIDRPPQTNDNDDNNNSNNVSGNSSAANENLLSEASRQIRLLETGINAISSIPSEPCKKIGIVKPMTVVVKNAEPEEAEKDLFEGGSESLILNDSILHDFKNEEEEEESSILRLGTDCAILSSIFNNQPNEPPVNESLLRNILAPENPVFSCPLPGFSQIFHNSNANSN